MRVEITRMNIMLDQLCFEVLGTDTGGVVEAALALNPGLARTLAANGLVLPLGITVILPDPETTRPVDRTIKLWD